MVRGVVQRPPVLGHVDLGRAERPPDHRRRRLVHRQPAGHLGGEPHSEQVVPADRPGHVGAELDPVRPVPQDRLRGDAQVAELVVATSRDPTGERSPGTVAAADDEPTPGPLGDRCHGPSFHRGCCSYSSCSTRSLPGPASTSRPVRRSTTEVSAPPRAGSAVTVNASLEIVSPSAFSQSQTRTGLAAPESPALPRGRTRRAASSRPPRRGGSLRASALRAVGTAGTRAAARPSRGTSASPRRATRPRACAPRRPARVPGRPSPGR